MKCLQPLHSFHSLSLWISCPLFTLIVMPFSTWPYLIVGLGWINGHGMSWRLFLVVDHLLLSQPFLYKYKIVLTSVELQEIILCLLFNYKSILLSKTFCLTIIHFWLARPVISITGARLATFVRISAAAYLWQSAYHPDREGRPWCHTSNDTGAGVRLLEGLILLILKCKCTQYHLHSFWLIFYIQLHCSANSLFYQDFWHS